MRGGGSADAPSLSHVGARGQTGQEAPVPPPLWGGLALGARRERGGQGKKRLFHPHPRYSKAQRGGQGKKAPVPPPPWGGLALGGTARGAHPPPPRDGLVTWQRSEAFLRGAHPPPPQGGLVTRQRIVLALLGAHLPPPRNGLVTQWQRGGKGTMRLSRPHPGAGSHSAAQHGGGSKCDASRVGRVMGRDNGVWGEHSVAILRGAFLPQPRGGLVKRQHIVSALRGARPPPPRGGFFTRQRSVSALRGAHPPPPRGGLVTWQLSVAVLRGAHPRHTAAQCVSTARHPPTPTPGRRVGTARRPPAPTPKQNRHTVAAWRPGHEAPVPPPPRGGLALGGAAWRGKQV
ncbi:hypothetical protein T492DRAFT_836985 [Pavlovales sp. CCMP2436]|nr:hypothetical protein T492DRAFT_836985 [Pavlovales sp. CCMP2436]